MSDRTVRSFVKRRSLWMFALLAGVGCGDDSSDFDDSVGLCYHISGNVIQTSCSGGNRDGSCGTAGSGYTWYGDYEDFVECGDAQRKLKSDWMNGKSPSSGGSSGGSSSGQSSGSSSSGADCFSSCPSESSDVQLDSFCRAACCQAITGHPDQAQQTCAAGSSLGTSSCSYCD